MKFRWRLEHTMEQVIKKRLQQVMDASVAKGETPGCILMVIKDGEEQVYLESGYADIEAKKPVSRDNIFRLYSMSKPITATAMMILVERGIVDLADPVSKYLPGFRNPVVCTADGKIEKAEREILLEDIMNMTSGLTYGGTDETGRQTDALFQEVIHGLKEENGGTISTVEFANRLGEVPLLYQPGQSWSYGTSAISGFRQKSRIVWRRCMTAGRDSRPSVIWTITLAFRTIWRTARHMRQAEQALHLPSTIMRNLRRCC